MLFGRLGTGKSVFLNMIFGQAARSIKPAKGAIQTTKERIFISYVYGQRGHCTHR